MEFSRFLPLITVIHADLGPDWGFYQEFLEKVIDAAGRGEDTEAWYEQIETLVGEQSGLLFAHEGVCFLLRGLEAKAREAPVPGSLPAATRVYNTAEPMNAFCSNSNMAPPPPSSESAADKHKTEQAKVATTEPSDPSPTITNALKNAVDPRCFTDETFRRDIDNFFFPADTNHTAPVQDDSELAPPYFARDNDLAVWKKRVEDGGEMKGDKSSNTTSESSK